MELLTVELPHDTRRRLEVLGFNYGLTGRDVIEFLLDNGLSVLEQRFKTERVSTVLPTTYDLTPA
jgi:hypothetical protein